MELKEDLVRTQTLETGCNNKQYRLGFTLIGLLVGLIIIGITATLITVNFNSLNSIEKQSNSFQKTVNFLTEESIILHSPVLQPSLQQPSAQQVSLQQVSILSDNSFITELPC